MDLLNERENYFADEILMFLKEERLWKKLANLRLG